MNREELLDTIQRLLALSSSNNEHEAQIAAARASELMMRHNIAMSEVNNYQQEENENWVTENIYSSGRADIEQDYICSILKQYFFVYPIKFRNYKLRVTTLKFFGDKSNVEVAKYVYNFLKRVFYETWKFYSSLNGLSTRHKQAFYLGLYTGFSEKLKNERESSLRNDLKSANALVLVGNKIENALTKHHPQMKPSGQAKKVTILDQEVYNKGVTVGKTINLRKGIESANQAQEYLQ